MKNNERQIETFEMKSSYYATSFRNGNKSHVAEELSELLLVSLYSFNSILIDLPKEVQKFILNSEYYKDANLKLTLRTISTNWKH